MRARIQLAGMAVIAGHACFRVSVLKDDVALPWRIAGLALLGAGTIGLFDALRKYRNRAEKA